MRLIELSSDHPKFRTVTFNRTGLSIIIGKKNQSLSSDKEGDSNGVGKTLLLELVDFCLGSKNSFTSIKEYAEANFILKFELKSKEHIIKRSCDGKTIYLNEEKKTQKQLLDYLNTYGPFDFDANSLSFRGLFRWYARVKKEYCNKPLEFSKQEPEYFVLLQAAYLLNIDCSYIIRKKELRSKEELLKRQLTFFKNNSDAVQKLYKTNDNAQIRLQRLNDTEIPHLKNALDKWEIAENYKDIEKEANDLKIEIDKKKQQVALIDFQLRGIEKTLDYKIDITKDELLALYDSLTTIFKPEALQNFSNVQAFHNSLHAKRKERLLHDQLELIRQKDDIADKLETLTKAMDKKLQYLKGKKAIDEVLALSQQLIDLENQRDQLTEYLDFEKENKKERNKIKEKLLKDNEQAQTYLDTKPLDQLDKHYIAFVKELYKNANGGIAITNNDGDNQKRFDLTIRLSGEKAEGIGASMLRCFDWVIFLYGRCKETMNMLWHDNRLFAHTSEEVRAKWFDFVVRSLKEHPNKQYILSINEENYNSMFEFFSKETEEIVKQSVKITLSGDDDRNKLLGISFDTI